MHKIEKKEVRKATELLAKCLSEDPKFILQTTGIERKNEIIGFQAEKKIDIYMDKGDVYVLDDCKGILIGYNSVRLPYLHYLMAERNITNALNQFVTKDELKTIIKNNKLISKVEDIAWHKKASPTEQYYHITNACADKKGDDTNVYYSLLEPLLSNCDESNVTTVLETYNEELVPVMEGLSFKIVKVLTHKKVDLKQYCLIRKPESR